MNAVIRRLSNLKLTTFKVSYSPSYTSYIPHIIATNPSHPLYITQRRRQQELKKEGLWWHATNGTDLSKKSTVRTWARRRLRQAFVEELKAKGYDKTGKLVEANAMQERRDVMNVVRLGRSVDLTGSLRMHGVGLLIPAKFEAVKKEMRGIVDALVQGAVDTALGFGGTGEMSNGLRQRPQSRRPQERGSVAAPSAHQKKTRSEKEPRRVTSSVASAQALLGTDNTLNRPRKTGTASEPPRKKQKAASCDAAPRTRNASTRLDKAKSAS
jgi:hypothetical protein